MSSKKEDKITTQTEPQDVPNTTATDDWRPDYFPTSAKPVFKKMGLLFLGILVLCLFLAYCSQNDADEKKHKQEDGANPTQSELGESETDSEIF